MRVLIGVAVASKGATEAVGAHVASRQICAGALPSSTLRPFGLTGFAFWAFGTPAKAPILPPRRPSRLRLHPNLCHFKLPKSQRHLDVDISVTYTSDTFFLRSYKVKDLPQRARLEPRRGHLEHASYTTDIRFACICPGRDDVTGNSLARNKNSLAFPYIYFLRHCWRPLPDYMVL